MREKIKIKQAVIVEGKYDKIKLENIIAANIITTDGFKIYNNAEKRALIKSLAQKTGIIIFTDSDAAGQRIRGFIKSFAGSADIINIYAPAVSGKEKRKREPSKENILGVEGTDNKIIRELFAKFDAPDYNSERKISKLDFYNDGLSGGPDSAKKREYLCGKLNLPQMSANALLEAVNILLDYREYKKILDNSDNVGYNNL